MLLASVKHRTGSPLLALGHRCWHWGTAAVPTPSKQCFYCFLKLEFAIPDFVGFDYFFS
jgi:hypothetical protein